MKRAEDFKVAIGAPDATFENCVKKTLLSLESKETRRTQPLLRIVITVTVLLMLTVAAGAMVKNWDLSTFLRYYERNVDETIKKTPFEAEQWSNSWAIVAVKELRHDGCMLYGVYEIVPKEKETLLIFASVDDPEIAQAYLDSPWQTGEGNYSEETAAAYAQRTGADVVFVSMDDFTGTDRYACGELQAWRGENGVLTVYSAQLLETAAPEIHVDIHVEMQKWSAEMTAASKEKKTLEATLPAGQTRAQKVSRDSIYYDRYGVRLLETRVVRTELGTLLYTRYIIEEPEKCRHFTPTFEFSRSMNISRKFNTSTYEETDGSFSQYSWWGVLEEIPSTVTLEILHMDSHKITLISY